MPLLASAYDISKYYRSEDLKRDTKFRTRAVTEEVLEKDGKPEKKLALSFTNSEQMLLLNKTNLRTLRGAFGDDTANWVGRVIAVFPTMVDVRGKPTPALRVRIPPPKQPDAAAPQQPVTPGNGASASAGNGAVPLAAASVAAALALADPELEPDPVLSLRDELDDDIAF